MLRKHTQNQQNLQRNSGKDSDRIHSAPNVLISAENYSIKSDEYYRKDKTEKDGILFPSFLLQAAPEQPVLCRTAACYGNGRDSHVPYFLYCKSVILCVNLKVAARMGACGA